MKKLPVLLIVLSVLLGCENSEQVVTDISYIPEGKEITTAEELLKIGVDSQYPLSGSYWLGNDIDLSGIMWTPIGKDALNAFSGTFDGNGKTIRALSLPDGITQYSGLFGYTKGALIKNLSVEINSTNLSFNNEGQALYIAPLAAYAQNTRFNNINISGDIDTMRTAGSANYAKFYVGGLAGYTIYTKLEKCSVSANLKSSNIVPDVLYTGGIVSYADANTVIKDSMFTGTMDSGEATNSYSGGICAYLTGASGASSLIGNCYVNSAITSDCGGSGTIYAGSISGYTANYSGIEQSSAEGTLNAGNAKTIYAGGITAYVNQGMVKSSFSLCKVTADAASLSSTKIYAGGITAYLSGNNPGLLGIIDSSYSGSAVIVNGSASDPASGALLVGSLQANAIIKDSFGWGRVDVSGNGTAYAGGIAGDFYNGNVKVVNCAVLSLGTEINEKIRVTGTKTRKANRIIGNFPSGGISISALVSNNIAVNTKTVEGRDTVSDVFISLPQTDGEGDNAVGWEVAPSDITRELFSNGVSDGGLGWDFGKTWKWDGESARPKLSWEE